MEEARKIICVQLSITVAILPILNIKSTDAKVRNCHYYIITLSCKSYGAKLTIFLVSIQVFDLSSSFIKKT